MIGITKTNHQVLRVLALSRLCGRFQLGEASILSVLTYPLM